MNPTTIRLKNIRSTEEIAKAGLRRRSKMAERGRQVSESQRLHLSAVFPEPHGMAWVRRIEFPFSYAASKNHMARTAADGHVFLRKESRSYREQLAFEVKRAVADAPLVTNKFWLDLIVQKPNHRGDAVNVLDLVIDAVKDGAGLDDRWFCLRRLDWQVIKTAPSILIGLGQDSDQDARVCSYCGRVLPLPAFARNKGMPLGRSRSCADCGRFRGGGK